MKYAKIEEGCVVQVQPNEAEGFVEVADTAVPGQLYDAQTGDLTTPASVPTADTVRAERDERLSAVSWRFERYDSEVRLGLEPTDDIAELDTYAQNLRDIPEQTGFPEAVDWPVEPE